MKIVHICLCGTMTDGLTYQENIITKYHRKMGYEVTVIASQYVWDTQGKKVLTDKTTYRNDDDVKMIRLPIRYGTVDNRLKLYPDLFRTVEREAPDILFIHDCQFLDVRTLAKYLRKHPNVRAYVDNHVDYSNGAHGWLSKNVLHKMLWRSCAQKIEPYVRRFYGVLPARVDFLKELYALPAEKCALLVMGGDDEMIQQAEGPEVRAGIRAKYGIAGDDFLIMTGGKIDAFKTQTLLLMEAVRKIPNEKVRLIVFGSVTEELREQTMALADGKKVQYIGWVQAKDSYAHFAAADLVVFPGRHSVFWEQVAAQGIPMLVKDWPGTHHVDLGGNVRFLKKDSAQEIQHEIERLVDHPEEYRRMKQIAQEKGMQEFSYAQIAKRAIESGDAFSQ